MSPGAPLRILAVCDSDSYVKWGAFLVDRMPEGWLPELVVLATPWLPSEQQFAAALAGTRWAGSPPRVVELAALGDLTATTRPDVVLIAVRGPSVKVVQRAVLARVPRGERPVIVSGLPGISFPATRKAIAYRARADLMVIHSRSEREAFARLAAQMRIPQDFALATLPFVLKSADVARTPTSEDGPLVFAAQAKFPEAREDRLRLLEALAESARRRPGRRVIVKVRAAPGERQTHPEQHDFRHLLPLLDPPAPPNLVVEGGAMVDHLAEASALVTVSSTALLEAIGRGIPVLALADFGIRRSLVNTAFVGSGVLGTLDDLAHSRFHHPEPGWLADHWFHPASDDDWVDRARELVARRDAGELPTRVQVTGTAGGPLRTAWDRKRALGSFDRSLSGLVALAVGMPAMMGLRVLQRLRRRARASARAVFAGPAPDPIPEAIAAESSPAR